MVRLLTRENGVIAAGILAAFAVGGAVDASGVGPEWLSMAAFLGIAVVVPMAVNEWLDRRDRD
ncbi:hypothetical protein [Salinigranum sp. GCM10025319]|uniref:hypothetical protein n=1 Tax=Salinigranum sp. GCM10025319 TaxID=3252687 RepID=UPI0036112538